MHRTPPMTPPAITPTFGPSLDDFAEGKAVAVVVVEEAVPAATQDVNGQELQVSTVSEHVWPSGHVGHGGVSSGHMRHRLKSVLKETEPVSAIL